MKIIRNFLNNWFGWKTSVTWVVIILILGWIGTQNRIKNDANCLLEKRQYEVAVGTTTQPVWLTRDELITRQTIRLNEYHNYIDNLRTENDRMADIINRYIPGTITKKPL